MCTYETTYDFDVLLSDHGLAEGLNTVSWHRYS